MGDQGNQRVQELFLAALEMPANQRDAWLVEQCRDDQTRLSEVRSLLEHDNPDDDPLEKGLGEALDVVPSTLIPDKRTADEPSESDGHQVDNENFFSKLSEVGVLSPEEIEALNQTVMSGQSSANPRQIASQLVTQGKLTDYQASALLNGQPDLLIDKYLILDLLDAGGMGMVFKAIHRPMNRKVAVKMIAQHLLASPDQVKRFQREVRVAATLEHPNIVRSYDADQSRGVHFLVMEYVRGDNLTKIVQRQGPMSVEMAVDCIRQAAKGLRYAQKQGVIHRDIKPGNLMLGDEGLVKVLDLGLANIDQSFRLAQQSSITDDQDGPNAQSLAGSELTTAGTVLGTVSFMAPEQSLDAHTADTRADIYSLGCTLYYLLIGEAPYKGDTIFQVFMMHREEGIPTLRDKRPDVPERVEVLYRTMLAKSPNDRYQSMGELLAAIEDCELVPPPESKKPQSSKDSTASTATRTGDVSPTVSLESPQSTRDTTSKRRGLLGWRLAIILLVTLGGGYWWRQPTPNEGKSTTTVADHKLSERVSPDTGVQLQAKDKLNRALDKNESLADLLATGEYEWSQPESLVSDMEAPGSSRPINPHVSPDGLTLLFEMRKNLHDPDTDIWISKRSSLNEPWTKPERLGSPINTRWDEQRPHLSPDQLTLFFSSTNRAGTRGERNSDLWITTRSSLDDKWNDPVGFEFNSDGWESDAQVTSDNLELFFGFDGKIATSFRNAPTDRWSKPSILKLPLDESNKLKFSPWISGDGLLLCFEALDDMKAADTRNELWAASRPNRSANWGTPKRVPFRLGNIHPSYCPADRSIYYYTHVEGRPVLWVSKLVKKKVSEDD